MLRRFFQHFTRAVSREFCETWAMLDQDLLVNYARAHVGHGADAELIISQAMHQVMRAYYDGRVPRAELRPYALRTIRNAAGNLRRKEASRLAAEECYSKEEAIRSETQPRSTQAEGLDLRHAMQQLPGELAGVLIPHIWEGRTFADIAASLQLSESTVRRRYQQAITHIRKSLSPPP